MVLKARQGNLSFLYLYEHKKVRKKHKKIIKTLDTF